MEIIGHPLHLEYYFTKKILNHKYCCKINIRTQCLWFTINISENVLIDHKGELTYIVYDKISIFISDIGIWCV